MSERTVNIPSSELTANIYGNFDCNIKQIEKSFSVSIVNRMSENAGSDKLIITGSDEKSVSDAAEALEYLKKMATLNQNLSDQSVNYVIGMVLDGKSQELETLDDDCFCVTNKGKPIKAKTIGQKKYVDAIKKNTIVIGVGPAGTGKTFLAVAMAVKALRDKDVSRIVLTRPAVEAGERLGFLPGDLQSKIDPYLRPLYDALYEMLGAENCARHLEKLTIEIAPLAYMRGRTLDDSFIILDEAQNTTPEQMKMFLTRLGYNSKAVVTGDLTQTDLPRGTKSGLQEAVNILKDIEDIRIHEFTDRDVVRHKLVQKIILAYEKYDKDKKQSRTGDDYRQKRYHPAYRRTVPNKK